MIYLDTLPPVRSMWIILIILLLLSMLIRCIEQSTIVINDTRLKKLADGGSKKASRLLNFLDGGSGSFISSMQFVSAFLLLSAGICAAFMYLIPMTVYFHGFGMHFNLAFIISFVIIAMLSTIIYLILGEFIPKGIAGKYSESIALAFSSVSIFITYICMPFVCIPSIISRFFFKLFGVSGSENDEDVTEEEIRMMVDIGSESGVIDDDEKEMIHNIFEFDDKPIEDIMTHRTDAVVLWINDGADKWEQVINETNHTRYPVCGASIDDVIGVLNARDFYRFLLSNRYGDLRSILREPYFVPESLKADEVFSQMQKNNTHFGVVLDEYGGFMGIVTQEDLIEEIVGELYSEYDVPEQELEIYRLPDCDDKWVVLGSAEIDDVADELGIEIPDEEYNTFAGLILNELGTVPGDGETPELQIGNMKIRVTKIAEHRIDETVVTLIKDSERKSENEEKSPDSEGDGEN